MKLTHLFAASLAALAAVSSFAGGYLRMDKDFADGAPTKKIAFIGDSYVQNHKGKIPETWHYQYAEGHKYHYLNFGRNGNRVIFPSKGSGPIIAKRFKEIPADTDYIVIIAGHNDACAYNRLGGDDKHLDPATFGPAEKAKIAEMEKTFVESLPKFLANLKKSYPKAKIAWVTPWQVEHDHFPETIAAIKAACAKAGIPCCDATELTGIAPNDEKTRAKLFQSKTDTAHLNAAGHKLVLPKFTAWLDKALK